MKFLQIVQCKNEFTTGIKVLRKLTDGDLNICVEKDNQTFINEINDVVIHNVSGPHPSGNVGVQIHHIDPNLNSQNCLNLHS